MLFVSSKSGSQYSHLESPISLKASHQVDVVDREKDLLVFELEALVLDVIESLGDIQKELRLACPGSRLLSRTT